jgi:MoxR-like ATPase
MSWEEAEANLAASLAKDGAISVPLPRIDLTPAAGYQRMGTGRDVSFLVNARQNCALWGPAGASKTFPICEEFKRTGRPFVLVQCDAGVTVGDILGREIVTVDPKTGQTITRFQEGLLPACMRAGVPVVWDEFDFITPGVTPTLNDVGENRRITIRQTGVTITAHKGFVMLATGNSVGDETGLYTGTQPMNTALLSRFRHLRCEYPTPAQERSILEKVGLPKDMATKVAAAFAELRKAFTEARAFGQAPSVRAAVCVARLVSGKTPDGEDCAPADLDDAFSWAFVNCLVPAERVVAKEIWQRHTAAPVAGQATYSA